MGGRSARRSPSPLAVLCCCYCTVVHLLAVIVSFIPNARPPPPQSCAAPAADDAVEQRALPKSVSCGKTFRGRHALRDMHDVHRWLLELGGCGCG